MVDIIVNNERLELEDKAQNIKYSMQINDIFDLSTVNASYTNAFSIPKNPKNTQIFKMLGLVADPSRVPYERLEARLLDNGFPLIQKGWLKITETSDSYKINIVDGIVDFFKDIENKTIGRDLVLTELNHRKDLNTVVESFTNPYYKYIVADYGGKNITATDDDELGYNIDYLVPSANVPFIWGRIFSTFGYTFSGTIFDDVNFSSLWLSYPKAPEAADVTEPILVAGLEKLNYTQDILPPDKEFEQAYDWSITNIIEGSLIANWSYVIPSTQNFRIKVIPRGYIDVIRSFAPSVVQVPYQVQVFRGSNQIMSVNTSSSEEIDVSYDDYFSEGEIISFRIVVPSETTEARIILYRLLLENLKVNIYKLSFGDVSFNNALSDFPIKDFIKEIIWRFGLTPVTDSVLKHITFYTMDERLDLSEAIDWSSKYVSRTRESYIQGSYAQQNVFKHKYNDPEENFNNGYLYISNENLSDTKDIATSRTFSYDNRLTQMGNYLSFAYPIWQPEPKEVTNEDGSTSIEVNYKGLTGRFFMMRYDTIAPASFFISDILGGDVIASNWPLARAENTVFSDLIPIYYPEYERILNDFRMHNINLALTIYDILTLSFIKPYYFSQENNFYVLNKLTWESGKICTGEFIRLKGL